MTDFQTGWRRPDEDLDYIRKGGLVFTPSRAFGAPEEFDTRSIIAVENQGQTSSCVGHATSSLMEACAWLAARSAGDVAPEQFSRWYAYLQAQKQSGFFGSDQGATISGAAKGMKDKGCCFERTLPFPGRYVKTIPREADVEADKFKIRSHANMTGHADVFGFMAGNFGGVEIGISWTSRLANSNGVIELADVKGNGGGHALLLFGWSKRVDSQGRHYVWLHNSHGKSWGNGGRAEVAPDVIDWWGSSRNNEMIGFSDLTGFDTPRIVPSIDDVM